MTENFSSQMTDLGAGLGGFLQAITVPILFLAVGLGVGYAIKSLIVGAVKGAHK